MKEQKGKLEHYKSNYFLVQIGAVLTSPVFHFVKTLCIRLLMELLNFTWELTPEYLSSENWTYAVW